MRADRFGLFSRSCGDVAVFEIGRRWGRRFAGSCISGLAQEAKVFLILLVQQEKILFFSEEKNQKTFVFCAAFGDTGSGGEVWFYARAFFEMYLTSPETSLRHLKPFRQIPDAPESRRSFGKGARRMLADVNGESWWLCGGPNLGPDVREQTFPRLISNENRRITSRDHFELFVG